MKIRGWKRELLKGELTQKDVINKVIDGDGIVYAAFCGMKAHFGRKSVDYESIELHPTMRLKLESNKKDFISPISFSDDEESQDIMFFDRSFSKVTNLDTGEEFDGFRDIGEHLKFFDNKKDCDFYYLKTFKDFYNQNGFGKSIKYFRETNKELVKTDPDLVLKIIGK